MASSDHFSTTSNGSTGGSSMPEQQPMQGCLLRLFWMAIGNFLLLGCAGLIAKHKPWTFSAADIGYWTVVLLLLSARFVDIRIFHGETSNGEPATTGHLKRYVAVLIGVACAIWVLAHSISI